MTTEEFQLSCDDAQRRQLLQNSTTLNGINYLEVIPPEETGDLPLIVVFLYHAPTPPLGPTNFLIEGGTRITNIGIEWANPFAALAPVTQALVLENVTVPDPTKVVVIRPTSSGDFSTYTLQIVQASNPSELPPGYDPLLSQTPFGFKVECPPGFDCAPQKVCPPEILPEPVIDYLSKDFDSFNTLMLNRLALINPNWQERHPADMGVALVELLAYVGDQLSYYQDAVATEAYLGTARRRISIRRHARLLDYMMHDGCNARAWVTMEIDPSVDGLVVPAGMGLLTGGDGDSTVVTGGLDLALEGATVFETMTDVLLYSAQNQIQFYTWQEEDCCLPLGGTTVTLNNANRALDIPVFTLAGASGLGTGTPQAELIQALAGTSTKTSGTNPGGQDVLGVVSTGGLAKGTVIVVNPGGADQESAVIAYVQVGSVALTSNLANLHPAGEAVVSVPLAGYLLAEYGADWMVGALYSITSGPTGTSTTGTTATVLQDTGADWTAGEWVGDDLEYTSGPAMGQSRPITANTATSVTTAAFSPAPTLTGGDSFSLVTDQATLSLTDGVHSATVAYSGGPTASVTVDGNTVDELVVTSGGGNLVFSAHTLRIGTVLIFEEVRSPTTGRVPDADPTHRCAVRLTGVSATVDPLDPAATPLLDVTWDPADAPSFPLCLEDVLDPDFGDLPEPVSVAHGNTVLVDNGQTQALGILPLAPAFSDTTTAGSTANVLQDTGASWMVNQWVDYHLEYTSGPAEGQSLLITANTATTITTAVAFVPGPTASGGDSFSVANSGYVDSAGQVYTGYSEFLGNTPKEAADASEQRRFQPGLSYLPVTFAAPFDPTQPASSAFGYDVRTALPTITVLGQNQVWTPQRDLLSSDAFQYQFVAEVDNDGTAYLRFGDGVQGAQPTASTEQDPNPFYTIYRIGNGSSGNVGREAISRVVNTSVYGSCVQADTPFDGTGILAIRNPMEAQGGTDPEAAEDVRQFAPYAFDSQQRAVTVKDYEAILARYPGIEQGFAQLKWTGSWWTYYISVDRTGGLTVDAPFQQQVETYLNSYRMAGYDLDITNPVFVPLEIEMHVCVAPGYSPSNIQQTLLQVFSSNILPDGAMGFFHPDNFTFGQTVYLSTIYETATGVAGVSSVVVEVFQRYGRVAQGELATGEIKMEASEVARLDNDPNFPENGIMVITVDGGETATGVGSLP